MKIYHYTTIQTLALILKHKTIRFNRLDLVDDKEEAMYGSGQSNTKLGQYTFVSCWTKDATENLPLWKMYTDDIGVRIGLDEDMFVTYKVNDHFKSLFDNPFGIHEDYIACSFLNEAKLYDVIYAENYKDEINKLIISTGNDGMLFNISASGLYKRKEWEIQHESRFKLFLLPVNLKYFKIPKDFTLFDVMGSLMRAIGPSLVANEALKVNYIDIPLQEKALQKIEVMMGPKTSEGDRIIVESLLRDFTNAEIIDSDFKHKIRI